jgi:hypothetical protein
MVTEKISECTQNSKYQYCNFCSFFDVGKHIILRGSRARIRSYRFGRGGCVCPDVNAYRLFSDKACEFFEFNFHPKYGTISENELKYHRQCCIAISHDTPILMNFLKNRIYKNTLP